MPRGKRQNGAAAAAAQPAKFGIQHFFARHASTQSQVVAGDRPVVKSTNAVTPAKEPEPPEEPQADCTPTVLLDETEFCENAANEKRGGTRKRMRLSPSEILPHTQDDGGDEIVWKDSPTAQRLQACSTTTANTSSQNQRLALRPCRTNVNSSLQGVYTLVSPCSKISPGIAGQLETWLSSSTKEKQHPAIADKENVPYTQANITQSAIAKLSATPRNKLQIVGKSPKRGTIRQDKRGKHRKALLDLLDQVELVMTEEKLPDKEMANDIPSGLIDINTEGLQSRGNVYSNADRPSLKNSNIHYLVLEVSEFQKDQGSYPEKILRLLDETNGAERMVCLRDEWSFTVVRPGDTVNIIGNFDPEGRCIIDHENNLLVLHPDVLVSGSRVGSSFSCARRAVLDDRVKCFDVSFSALLGTMLHRLFQAALTAQQVSRNALQDRAKRIVIDNIDGLYAVRGYEKEVLTRLVEAVPTMIDWIQNFKNSGTSTEPNVDFGMVSGKHHVSISEVVDIEEMVWSPKYGLKGMIDASLRVRRDQAQDEYLPLEFKTGKATAGQAAMEHRAQVILYTLLMSDRYSDDVSRGVLYYLHKNQTQGIEVQPADITGLMMRRNEHATNLYLASSTQALPATLQGSHACQGCRMLDICSVYHKVQEGGTRETSGLGELFDALTGHLTQKHAEFLKHWDRLIDLEAQVSYTSQTEVWRRASSLREEQGRCLSSMLISTESVDRDRPGGFLYTFRKSISPSDPQQYPHSLDDQAFTLGDYVLLSTESGHTAVAGAVIRCIDSESLTVSLSHPLRLPGGNNMQNVKRVFKELWRIDKDDSSSSFAIMRYNILQLFVRDGARRSRELIVDLEPPKFDSHATATQDPAASYVRSITDLNADQRSAVGRVLAARDYALILGMPGTGKTSTVVHAVKALLARGSSVLVASYTNSALDNILLKLKHQQVDFIRVGRSEAIHPELIDHAVGSGVMSVEDLTRKIDQAQVVGATCLGITHALFTKRKFDVCIIDEAGQITLPVCIGPLRYAHAFVLVGDHYQLPPLVQNVEAREKGMAISLFRLLSEAHPEAVLALQCQYRMCSEIMYLSNALIYGNRLRCGSADVANARLHVNVSRSLPTWSQQVLDSNRSVIFLDTDNISCQEKRHGSANQNILEGSLVMHIISALKDGGVNTSSIGVISPYKAQVDYIKRRLGERGLVQTEAHTIDKYQGRDKDCILVSFVRSGNQRISGSLLTDWHRINVAITRAKKKIIMIGSANTLSTIPLLRLLIQQVDVRGGLMKLPEDTLTSI